MFRGSDAPKQQEPIEKKPTSIQEGKNTNIEKKEPPAKRQEAEVGVRRPEHEKPKAPESKVAKVEPPKVEKPKAPENKTTKVEQTKVEKSKAPESKTAKVEQPKVEKPKPPENKTTKVEQSKVEKPKAPESKVAKVEQPKVEKPKAPERKATKVEQPKAPENKAAKVEQSKAPENKTANVEQSKAPENKTAKVEQPKAPEYKTVQAERPKASENGETTRESKIGEDFRKQKSEQLDNEYSSIAKVYNKATELSATDETRKAAFTADYESSAKELKEKLKEDLKDIESQMAKFKGKSMEMGEYSEWKMLNSEKSKREEQLSDVGKMLDKAKNFERNNAFEQSADRYNAIRGESKKDRKEDLKKDQACVRNNIATARGIRQDIADTKSEINNVKAKLADIANTYSIDDMRSDPKLDGVYKEFTSLDRKYAVLSDKLETYEKQLNRLDDLNKKLSEIHGTDKDGHPILEVPDLRKEVTDKTIDDAIKSVKESSDGALNKDKLEPKDCVEALNAINNAERVVIPALAEQVSGLEQQLSQVDSYLKNNSPDAYFTNLKAKLEKDYAEKLSQFGDLVESTTRLKTHLETGDLKHSAKCIVNADGTYTLQQRWTNVKEKISDHGSFKNTRQFYSNAYDRVSNCKFDEKGNILSEDFSFKYKLLGYFSERKFGGEKLNLHNVFETGLLNVKAKGGWDQDKGFNVEGGASVFEIKDTATLNILNKQVMQLNSHVSYMEAKGKAEFDREKTQMNASFSVNDGWSGGADVSVGRVKLLESAFGSWTNSISGKFDLAKAVDGKLEGIKASGEQADTFSYSIGDQIRMYEYENKNGVEEHKVFVSDITDLLGEDTGFSDIKDVYDTYTEQKESFDDIFEKGIAKDEVSNKEKVAFQTKQHADEDSKFNRSMRDAKDLGERTLNGAANGEQAVWIKEADVLNAMDKTFLSLDDQKLVSETIDKIQKGEPLAKDDVDQLEYIHMQLAGNDFTSEARAISHLYSKSDMAVRDDAENIFAGAIVEKKETRGKKEKIKTADDGKISLNASTESGKVDWVSQDELNFAIKKSYLASDDMALVVESADRLKQGESITDADFDQLMYIAETLSDNGYDREAKAITNLADAGKEYPELQNADVASKTDIWGETRENLGAFEQNKWDNLSQVEKEQAIEKLRDSIAEDLQLKNKPNIVYYNLEDPGDYGGYAASTNTIYINRFNIDNAAETADTIAHESRHCWQHERAENPQTEQDYQFKENFENYTRPELNFEAYYSQPVEQDAREYAEQIKELIPASERLSSGSPVSDIDIKNDGYNTGSARAPPNEDYQSKTVTELPADFESKEIVDSEAIKKIAPSIHGADDFRTHMSSVYKDENRTAQEKFEYAKKLYDEIPRGQRTDINVIDNFKAIRTDKESLDKGIKGGYLPIAFHDHHGLDETKPINGIENGQSLPNTLCRRGGEAGNNLTELHEDGSVPSVDEIAVPYAENPESVHVYKTDADAYKEAIDIISSIDSTNVKEKTQDMNALIEKMNDKYELNNRPVSEEMLSEYAKSYNKFQNSNDTQQCRTDENCDTKYGVCGTVAPMHVDDDPSKEKLYNGGAAQYNTPCPIETFTRLGVFREDE